MSEKPTNVVVTAEAATAFVDGIFKNADLERQRLIKMVAQRENQLIDVIKQIKVYDEKLLALNKAIEHGVVIRDEAFGFAVKDLLEEWEKWQGSQES